MASARDILIRPLITEKATALMADNKYTFIVPLKANKVEIRQAVEQVFKVKVLDVNTIRVMGKMKRMGRTQGRRPDYKKAIVKLAPGQSIEFFEGL
jgi:large subunit ribosomal protein L23